jgi:hypothetical protein
MDKIVIENIQEIHTLCKNQNCPKSIFHKKVLFLTPLKTGGEPEG